MHKTAIALLAVLFSFWGCVAYDNATRHRTSYELVCAEMTARYPDAAAPCDTIEPPEVVRSYLVDINNNYGMYIHGERQIFLAKDLGTYTVRSVTMHETVHYLLYWMGEAQVAYDRCAGEGIAREITAKLTGVEEVEWRHRYGC